MGTVKAAEVLHRNNVHVTGNLQAERTLVFINGIGTDQTAWHQVTPAFERDFRLVLFDHVGSIPDNQPAFLARQVHYLNITGYADDLLEVCDALDLASATLIGHSLGAMVGLLAAVRQSSRVERLVLIGASPRYTNTEGYTGGLTEADIHATYEALQRDHAGWVEGYTRMAMGNPDRPMLAQRFAQCMARVPQEMMLTVLCSVLQTDHRASVAQVRQPTLIIQSQEDYFVPPAVSDYLRSQIPNSQLRVIEATGHLPHMSAPAVLVEAMQDFLRAPLNASAPTR